MPEKCWKFEKSAIDGQCKLFGVNIFDFEWEETGETATVYDPQYNQPHKMQVYNVKLLSGETKTFAAGEFSNCVWGFYLPE